MTQEKLSSSSPTFSSTKHINNNSKAERRGRQSLSKGKISGACLKGRKVTGAPRGGGIKGSDVGKSGEGGGDGDREASTSIAGDLREETQV